MKIFDGLQFAAQKEIKLQTRVQELKQGGVVPQVAAILFSEDKGSQLYTRLKKEAAERVGIKYQVHQFSFFDKLEVITAKLAELNADPSVTGIIIQKPAKAVWQLATQKTASDFLGWWQQLVLAIDTNKDVDGLHPQTLQHIQAGDWQQVGCVLPATAKAVLLILTEAGKTLPSPKKIIILGKSDILGQPLYYELKNRQQNVEMIGSKELQERQDQGKALFDADVIISATGRPRLITGDLISPGVILIDVGEPQPDIDQLSVVSKAAFLTPVPGGVGPVTIVCLLENALQLCEGA